MKNRKAKKNLKNKKPKDVGYFLIQKLNQKSQNFDFYACPSKKCCKA